MSSNCLVMFLIGTKKLNTIKLASFFSFLVAFNLLAVERAGAFVSGPKLHPLDVMHGLPRGEAPGWLVPTEVSLETNVSNVWNRPLTVQNKVNGEILTYVADYEQVSQIVSINHELLPTLQGGLEAWYVGRSGGGLDNSIDETHRLLRMARFAREKYPANQVRFGTTSNDFQFERHEEGSLSHFVLNLKWWILSFENQEDSYDGLSLAWRTKWPLEDGARGLSSGDKDHSLGLHFGYPLQKQHHLLASLAYSRLGTNYFFRSWPRYEYSFMYNLGLRLKVSDGWHFVLSQSAQTPLIDVSQVDYVPPLEDQNSSGLYRTDPGWRGLTEWRSQQTLALERIWSRSSLAVYMTEDWDFGDTDIHGSWLFISAAPDVSFGVNYTHSFGN